MLTIEQAALASGLSTTTIRRRIRAGKLEAEMIEGRWMIDPDQINLPDGNLSTIVERAEPEPAAIQPMLSTLHDLANQLAEATERAAIAETKLAFLEQRLAELRAAAPNTQHVAHSEPAKLDFDDFSRRRWWHRKP